MLCFECVNFVCLIQWKGHQKGSFCFSFAAISLPPILFGVFAALIFVRYAHGLAGLGLALSSAFFVQHVPGD